MTDHGSKTAVALTQFSHGAGCGCKIAPDVLREMLAGVQTNASDRLLVGNLHSDDAAAYALDSKHAVLSTTDFFTPIVDNPIAFGEIAVANALSDIYAMGGRPLMAIAILGWPVEKLDAQTASAVLKGGANTCRAAGIPLAGGHSIDTPEPIFGAAITGLIEAKRLKRNDRAKAGDLLFLSKPLGVGILTTAQKRGLLREEHQGLAESWMRKLNDLGTRLGGLDGVRAMTDVTGFGLAGHLLEMCRGASLSATVDFASLPLLEHVQGYISQGAIPGGTERNFRSYGHEIDSLNSVQKAILCDPQTSGGLLIAVDPGSADALIAEAGDSVTRIGAFSTLATGPLLRLG